MSFDTIRWEAAEGVGTLTLHRPEHMNGMTNTMTREVHELLHEVARDDGIAVVILTGAGRAFCPGADLNHYTSGAPGEPSRPEYFDAPILLHTMPQVTIAAINGACAGAGLGYACACDLRYAADGARLNTAFLDVAVAGDMGLPWLLPRLIGADRARELSLLPRKLDAAEAAALGLVNDVFAPDALLDEVRARADRIAAAAPLARRALKAHDVDAESMPFADFVHLETERHLRIAASDDCREAFAAYVEKRTPKFVGH